MLENLCYCCLEAGVCLSLPSELYGFSSKCCYQEYGQIQTKKGLDFLFMGYLYVKQNKTVMSVDSLQISVFAISFFKVEISCMNFQDYPFPNCLTELCKSHW